MTLPISFCLVFHTLIITDSLSTFHRLFGLVSFQLFHFSVNNMIWISKTLSTIYQINKTVLFMTGIKCIFVKGPNYEILFHPQLLLALEWLQIHFMRYFSCNCVNESSQAATICVTYLIHHFLSNNIVNRLNPDLCIMQCFLQGPSIM